MRRAPQIGVVVNYPAARTVMSFSDFAPLSVSSSHHRVNGSVNSGGGGLGRPVVHLRIDVDRIFAVPRWRGLIVPDALRLAG
jgi:hypothetical protein